MPQQTQSSPSELPSIAPGTWERDPEQPETRVRVRIETVNPDAVQRGYRQLLEWREVLANVSCRCVEVPQTIRVADDGNALELSYHAPLTIGLGEGEQPGGEERALTVAFEVAQLLDELHDQGVIHGGFGSFSVWRMSDGRVVFPDVGLLQILGGIARPSAAAAAYFAPELWKGEHPTQASDQFALAVACHEILTGRRRAASINEQGVVSVGSLELDLFTKVHAQQPREAILCLKRALHNVPASRFDRCSDFLTALLQCVSGPATGGGGLEEGEGSGFGSTLTLLALGALLIVALSVVGYISLAK